MTRSAAPALVLLGLLLAVPVRAQEGPAPDDPTHGAQGGRAAPQQWGVNSQQDLGTAWNHDSGDVVTRFAVDFTAVAGLGNDGNVDLPDNLRVGLLGGLGYFPLSQVSADLDLSTSLLFANSGLDLSTFTITPGTRVYPIPEAFLRLGFPLTVTSPFTAMLLGGAGYEYPVSDSQTLVGELDVTYPLTADGVGTITLGGGTSFTF